jgi:hypothetical protein
MCGWILFLWTWITILGFLKLMEKIQDVWLVIFGRVFVPKKCPCTHHMYIDKKVRWEGTNECLYAI